ncbi:MAG: HpcH/HpaI aldolase family protein [Caldilineaceae bacterium]
MKPNRLKQKLAAGEMPVGHMIVEFGTRGIAQIMANAGVDFVVIDTEHTPYTTADLADLFAWFKATPIAPFVRIPEVQYHFISRIMDAGALGVMVPDVASGSEARAVVDAIKYAPLGKRGMMMNYAHTDYAPAEPLEFTAYANENSTVICQIESEEGLANLEEIAATPGVDILWVGHSDMTNSMGISGQFHHPRFLDALQLVVDTAQKHGLAAAIQPGNREQAAEWIELGFGVISYSVDHAVYAAALKQAVVQVREMSQDG